MARSQYIYLIRWGGNHDSDVVAAFTVKHEAHSWFRREQLDPETHRLTRIRDGLHGDKTEVDIPWELE